MCYAWGMKLIEKDTVIVTEAGNIIAKAGDLLNNVEVGTVVNVVSKNTKDTHVKDRDKREVQTPEKMIVVNKHRVEPVYYDMDMVLPRDLLQKRKRLIKQRMEQERLR